MSALNFLKSCPIFYGENGFSATGDFGEDKVAFAMKEYSDLVNIKIRQEAKRAKLQRNEYEQQLMKANREIMKLRAELKLNS